MLPNHLTQLEIRGHALYRGLVAAVQLARLREEAVRLTSMEPDRAHGIRGLLKRSAFIEAWAHSDEVLAVLPPGMRVVRGILFDKTPETNWKVAWHQDLTIAVTEKADLPDYGPWSVKDGVVHVQPPMSLLEGLVTLRLHLDDTPASNGALRVIPGSHQHGRLSAAAISENRATIREHVCEAGSGDALLMKPLVLHASAASTVPAHRRVIHLEYAVIDSLHPRLSWAEAPAPSFGRRR